MSAECGESLWLHFKGSVESFVCVCFCLAALGWYRKWIYSGHTCRLLKADVTSYSSFFFLALRCLSIWGERKNKSHDAVKRKLKKENVIIPLNCTLHPPSWVRKQTVSPSHPYVIYWWGCNRLLCSQRGFTHVFCIIYIKAWKFTECGHMFRFFNDVFQSCQWYFCKC